MKNLFKTRLTAIVLVTTMLLFPSCSQEFLERPPEDAYSMDAFYKTNEQVQAAPNHLYSRPWYTFINNTSWAIGELSSGNARTWDSRNTDFSNFAITGEHGTLTMAWESMYAVIGQANSVINNLPQSVGPDVSEEVMNNAIAEARFIRATAYFYLVRIFGSVPIIEDNTDYVLEPVVPRNPVDDVYEFIKRDLEFAIDNLFDRSRYSDHGRVTSGSAKAMLAKIYLYEENWSMACQLAEEVINSGEFQLMEDYHDLFLTANDNNPETIFALQWTTSGRHGEGNGLQSFWGPAGITGFSDGWSAIGPSIDLQQAYEHGDERYYTTIMEPGAYYPDLNNGYTVPDNLNHQGTGVGIKKYVVGNAATNGGGSSTNYPNNTYIMRYADLLLIHAEAAFRGGCSMAEGLQSFNKVRQRAGLAPKESLTFEDIFHERRIELAFEMEFWYDVVRQGPEFAIDFLSNTERGPYNGDGTINSQMFTPTMDDMHFPYPTNETINNPALLEEPVPYDFE